MRPKVVLLVKLRLLGSLYWLWLKTLVNCTVNVAPTRSVNFRSLANVASTFQRFKPRRFPTPPQLVSSPKTQRRKLAKIEAGSAKMLTPLELVVPTGTDTPPMVTVEPVTPV